MSRKDSYSLKNASLKFKISSTLWLLFSLGLIAWSWFISLTVISWNSSTISRHQVLGMELLDLAWSKFGTFVFLFALQTVAYVRLWSLARNLIKRSSLRKRIGGFLSKGVTLLVILNFLIWLTVPFVNFSQEWAGVIGAMLTMVLVLIPLPLVWQMWFYPRWKNSFQKKKRVVIVGGGFAGLYAALGLDKALGYHSDLDLTVIDQKNYFLFPPLLPSAAVGTIETPQVTYPFRRIFETTNINFKKGTVLNVDPKKQHVHMRVHLIDSAALGQEEMIEQHIPYDYLVLAPGSVTQTFNTKGVKENSLFVRELEDAVKIRNRIIDCFERAACSTSETLKKELVKFAVIGGGPTGIETATEIRDLIHEVLLKRYPEINPSWPEVVVIQSGPQILPGWPEDVVKKTTEQMKKLGVRLVLNTRVVEVKPEAVLLKDGTAIQSRTSLWCAGVQPSPLVAACQLPVNSSGRITITKELNVADHPNIFVLGDAAHCLDSTSDKPLPPLGQVAFQQGAHTAKNLVRLLRGQNLLSFRYFNYGALVSVGEHYAAVNLLGIKFSGFTGWIIWRSLYLAKIIGMSNRIRIVVDWTLDLLIERSISQFRLEEEQKS